MGESNLKTRIRDFWDDRSCGEVYAQGQSEKEYYETHRKARYELEPYILDFARFHEGQGKDVLEIGVGMGADLIEWAKARPRSLSGVDLTPRAIEHARKRLDLYGFKADVKVADAEALPFDDNSFDMVYSWGVLHVSPDTPRTVREVHRVLRPGGKARIMIYHKYSLTGYMLWIRYALLGGRPFRSLADIYWNHLESPGTKAYTKPEAGEMFKGFSPVDMYVRLSFADLLYGAAGQRHKGVFLNIARSLWPRPLLKTIFKNHGLILCIEATKPKV